MVKLVQLLCPQRHCIIAAAYEEGRNTFDQVCREMKGEMQRAYVNEHCGICGSIELHFEEGTTGFKTMNEASGPLIDTMVNNLATRGMLDADGLSFDKRRSN